MPIPVNLYVDRLAYTSPTSQHEVWNDTNDQTAVYRSAAQKIGMTPAEYQQFRQALMEGRAVYVKLPRVIGSMAGRHRNGQAYALNNVRVPENTMGWEVDLADGASVYVPRICGNLSMTRSQPRKVAIAPRPSLPAARHYAAVPVPPPQPAIAETPVTFAPPPAVVAAAPAAVPAAVAAATHGGLFGLALPLVGFLFPHGGSTSTPGTTAIVAPPCTLGSNSTGVCQR